MTICADEGAIRDSSTKDNRIAASSILGVAITEEFDEVNMKSLQFLPEDKNMIYDRTRWCAEVAKRSEE
jgi:hypothetical protein